MDIIKISSEFHSHINYNLYLLDMCEKLMPSEYASDVRLEFYNGRFNQGRVYSDLLVIDTSVMSYQQYKRDTKLSDLIGE